MLSRKPLKYLLQLWPLGTWREKACQLTRCINGFKKTLNAMKNSRWFKSKQIAKGYQFDSYKLTHELLTSSIQKKVTNKGRIRLKLSISRSEIILVLGTTNFHNGIILSTLNAFHGFVFGFPKRPHTNEVSISYL